MTTTDNTSSETIDFSDYVDYYANKDPELSSNLVWSAFELASKFLPKQSTNFGKAVSVRDEIIQGGFIANLMGGAAAKFSTGVKGDSDKEIAANIATGVIDLIRVVPLVSLGCMKMLTDKSILKIKNFHSKLSSFSSKGPLVYKNSAQKTNITNETSLPELLKLHQDFLKHNLKIQQDVVNAYERKIAGKISKRQEAKKVFETKVNELKVFIAAGDDTDPAQIPDLIKKGKELAKFKNKIADTNKEIKKLLAAEDPAAVKSAKGKIVKLNKEFDTAITLDSNYAKYGRAAEGLASTAGFLKFAVDMSKIDSTTPDMVIAQQALSVASDVSDTISAALDVVDAAKYGKVAKSLGAFAGSTATIAASMEIAEYAKVLKDPNLPSWQRTYIEAELGMQAVTMTLSTMEGALMVAQGVVAAGSKAANFLGKAVPVVGAVAAIAGAFSPAKWAEFKQKDDRIAKLAGTDDHSATFLAEILKDTVSAERGFHAAATIIDSVTSIAAAGLSATGAGAGAGIIVGFIGGAISSIIQALQQTALEDIADGYAHKMRIDKNLKKQTIESFFEGSFDKKQEKIKAKYENLFDDMMKQKGYDSIFSLGSQTLSSTDLSLAAITKTGGELGKTAKHYFAEYFGGKKWNKSSIKLEPAVGADKIYLPDNGGGNTRYLTFMTPLMASGEEKLIRMDDGKNKYYTSLKISDMAGWEIIDQGKNNTIFSTDKIVATAESKAGVTVPIKISIKAKGGDDTYLAGVVATDFDGGSGANNVASYASLNGADLATGVTVTPVGSHDLYVTKRFKAGTKYFKETIDKHEESHGKRTDVIEYRRVTVANRAEEVSVTDKIKGMDILQTTDLDDNVDLTGYTAKALYTFGGNDIINTGHFLNLLSSGSGDDIISLGLNVRTVFSEGGDDYIDYSSAQAGHLKSWTGPSGSYPYDMRDKKGPIFFDGGQGQDTIKFSNDVFVAMRNEHKSKMENDILASQFSHSITLGQDSGQIAKMFQNMMGERTSLDRINVTNIEWFDYDLSDQTLTQQDTWYGYLFGGTISSYKGAWRTSQSQLKTWADTHSASSKTTMVSDLAGNAGAGELKHISGELYLEEGKTYEFKEIVDDYAALYIDGTKILGSNKSNVHTIGKYTSTKSGFVRLDFYAQNKGGPGPFKLQYKAKNEKSFKTLEALSQSEADFEGYLFGGTISSYKGAWRTSESQLKTWADTHSPSSKTTMVSDLAGNAAKGELKHISGQLYLEAGKTYEFKESVDDYSALYIDGTKILGNNVWNSHTTVKYTSTKSGFVQLDFYAQNKNGPGPFKLEYKAENDNVFKTLRPISQSADLMEMHSDWFDYDMSTRILSQNDTREGYLFEGVASTYKHVFFVPRYSKLKDWADRKLPYPEAKVEMPMDGVFAGKTTDVYDMKHITGKLYLEAGKTYEFKEYVGDAVALYIDGTKILEDNAPNSHTTGKYTPTKSGFVQLDFYANRLYWRFNEVAKFRLEYKVDGASSFKALKVVSQGAADWDGYLFDGTISSYKGALRTSESQLKTWADTHSASSKTKMDSDLDGHAGAGELKHISGEFYLEAGKTYEFKESVGGYAALYIDGTKILGDNVSNSHTIGKYTSTKSGFVQLDFYAQSNTGAGPFKLEYKAKNEKSFKTLKVKSESPKVLENVFDYNTAALNGISTGNEALDHTYYLTEYRDIVNHTLGRKSEPENSAHELKLFDAYVDTYSGISMSNISALAKWVPTYNSKTKKAAEGGSIWTDPFVPKTLKHVSGKVYLKAGVDYFFRETVDDYALLRINGKEILRDPVYNVSSTGTYKVSESGYYGLEFYAYDGGGTGYMKLEYKIAGDSAYKTIHVSNAMTTLGELNMDFSAASVGHGVNIIGSRETDKIEGSNSADLIFGFSGDDIIKGGAGNDVLVGGLGNDEFVFDSLSGHDFIFEALDSDFTHNTIKILDDQKGSFSFAKKGDDLIITKTSEFDWSISLVNYFDGVTGTQRLIDKSNGELLFSRTDTYTDYTKLSYGFRTAYEQALTNDLVKNAFATYDVDIV